MSKFRIEPHGRLQEWVAEEKGYFVEEGLDYQFVPSYYGSTQGPIGFALALVRRHSAGGRKRGSHDKMISDIPDWE